MSDEIWKDTIEELFQEFVEFFMPDLYQDIDFQSKYTFLDKELSKLFSESKEKSRRVDKLIQVKLKNGSKKLILVHCEVQSYNDPDFSERMFSYFYRIYDKFKQKIVVLAIFTDNDKNYMPNNFKYEFYHTELSYKYRTYKILEQIGKENELLESKNIFSLVILASLYSLKSTHNEEIRLKFKLDLAKLLLKKDYKIEKILTLFKFINVLLKINSEIRKNIFYEEVKKMALSEKKLRIISDYDSVVIKKEMLEVAKKMKNKKIDLKTIIEITGLSKEEIEKI